MQSGCGDLGLSREVEPEGDHVVPHPLSVNIVARTVLCATVSSLVGRINIPLRGEAVTVTVPGMHAARVLDGMAASRGRDLYCRRKNKICHY